MKPAWLKLMKLNLSLAVTLSAVSGYVLFSSSIQTSFFLILIGVFFLSSSAAAFNQIIEIKADSIMNRTKNRPLITKALSLNQSLVIAFLFLFAGIIFLTFIKSKIPLLLGILNIFWYIFVYTPLKYKTAFAAVFGAPTGAIPVLMGYTASGGNIMDVSVVFLAMFLFMWQIPHFWLLALRYGKDYENAGIISIQSKFSIRSLKRLILVWFFATELVALLPVIFQIIQHGIVIVFLIFFNFCSFFFVCYLLRNSEKTRFAFIFLNIYLLIHLLVNIFDKFID